MKSFKEIKQSIELNELSRKTVSDYLSADDSERKIGKKKKPRSVDKAFSKLYDPASVKVPATDNLRESYLAGDLFNVGDIVKTKSGKIGEIINLGTNYVTVVYEGLTTKEWLKDVVKHNKKLTEDNTESFSFKGYTPKNFTQKEIEIFESVIQKSDDSYAVFNCIQSVDCMLSVSKSIVAENFDMLSTVFDRAVRYLNKFDIDKNIISEAESVLLEYAILEGLKFSAADKMKVAMIVATAAGVDPTGTPQSIVDKAALAFKQGRHSPEGWQIIGKMLNKATEAGIKWNKNTFAAPTQKYMQLI